VSLVGNSGPSAVAAVYPDQALARAEASEIGRTKPTEPPVVQNGNVVITLVGAAPSKAETSIFEHCAIGRTGISLVASVAAPPAPIPETAISPGEPAPAVNGMAAGRLALEQSGCLGCHRIGDAGNLGPGPNLSNIGARLPPGAIARALVDPTAPMPSFRNLPPGKFQALVDYLSHLTARP